MPASGLPFLRYRRSQFSVTAKLVRPFRKWGYTEPQSIFEYPGEVVSGHADRHVVRVVIGRGPRRILAYLKREHRVRWRDRLSSWWRGSGALSLSEREARTITELRKLGLPVPRLLACGEYEGRGFLLLSAVRGAMDLRRFLHRMGAALPDHRRAWVARQIGETVARIHAAGYDAPDLLSKHVLIDPRRLDITVIDWARTRRSGTLADQTAARDLGRLHASLADSLATPRDRLRCLWAYWKARGATGRPPFARFVAAVERAGRRAKRRRSVAELLQSPKESAHQRLRWMDGERMCITRSLWQALSGTVPAWLSATARTTVSTERVEDVFDAGQHWRLQRWPAAPWWRQAIAAVLGRRVDTALSRQAGMLFRLKRYGIRVPTVLAFGRRDDGSGFLLTRPIAESQPLRDWLKSPNPDKHRVLFRIGKLMKKLHAAGLRLDSPCSALVVWQGQLVGLAEVPSRALPRPAGRWPFADLRSVICALRLNAAESARLVRGYLGTDATGHVSRAFAGALRGNSPSAGSDQIG